MKRELVEPLSSDAESLLAHERAIESLPDDARRRILERARRAPIALAASTQSGAVGIFAALPRARGARWFAAAALCVLLFALGAAAFYRARVDRGMPPSPTGPIEPSLVRAAAPTEERTDPSSGATATEAPPESVVTPLELRDRSPRPSESPRASESPRGSERGGAEGQTATVAELRLLRGARDALARHDHAAALAATTEHAKRFPAGQLVEEREAIRVEALAGLGKRDEARRAASAFRERFPKSVLLPTVERVLETTP